MKARYREHISLVNCVVLPLSLLKLKMLLLGLSSLVLAGVSWAQTPPGFTPNVTTHLDVIYPSATITPGLQMQKAGKFDAMLLISY